MGRISKNRSDGDVMRISELKKHALRSLDANWGKAIGVMFLILLSGALTSLAEIIGSGGFSTWWELESHELPWSATVANILVSFALIPFTIGCYWFFLNLSRRKNPTVLDTLEPYQKGKVMWKLIGASIVQGIFVFLWTLLFIIPGIIKGFAYSQTFFILKDHPEMGILDAITESRKRMNGLKWKYFLMNLSFIGWAILALLTFGIGYLFLLPYVYTTQGAFYQHLIADDEQDADDLIDFDLI